MKKILLTIAITGAISVSAQVPSTDAAPFDRANVAEKKAELREQRDIAKEKFKAEVMDLQKTRKQFNTDNAEAKAEFKAAAEERKEELRAEFQAAETEEEKQAIRDKAQIAREELQTEREEKKEERKAQARNFISERADLVTSRLQAGIDRGVQILARIDEVAQSFAGQGIDVSSVTSQTQIAQDAQNSALNTLASAREYINAAVSAETTEEAREALGQAKEAFKETMTSIKEMYAALRQAHGELKAVRPAASNETDAEQTN